MKNTSIKLVGIVGGVLLFLLAPVARAENVEVETTRDAMVISDPNAVVNFGTNVNLRVAPSGDTGAGLTGKKQSFIFWDVSSILPGSTINSVTFEAMQTDLNVGTDGWDVFALDSVWTELGVTWANQPGPLLANSWTTGPLPSDLVNDGLYSISNEELKNIVQGWVDAPSSNNGLGFYLATETDAGDTFAARENANPNQTGSPFPAKLTIDFVAIPEPMSIVLGVMALFGLGYFARSSSRRRSASI